MRSEQEVNRAVDLYADTVYRICMLHLKNTAGTEDIFQEVFLKYALSSIDFENETHEKAWIIRVTVNQCKDLIKSFFRSKTVSIDQITPPSYEPPFKCDYGKNIHTHGLTVINYNCVILDTSPVNIGANAFIAPGVCIACAGHSIDASQRGAGISTSKPINIGNDVWIGANATICPGVTIGNGTVIGAGSVVTKDIPSGVVAAGNPCRVIRKITEKDKIKDEDILF